MKITKKEANYVYLKVAPKFDEKNKTIVNPSEHHDAVNEATDRSIRHYSIRDWVGQLRDVNVDYDE